MKKRLPPLVVLLFLTFLIAILLLSMAARNSDGQTIPASTETPRSGVHQGVEEKARLLQDNNQDTYRALANEIFRSPRGFEVLAIAHGIGPTKIPSTIDNVIKDHLVYAEMQYRQGTGKAVREQSIVDLTNMLVQRFGLPDYVRTSPAQVRFMRMWLITVNPTFMGRGAALPNMRVGESISDEMSPLQAVHLLFEVLGHKFFDANFQMTPENWNLPNLNQGSAADTKSVHRVVATINTKSSEIRSLLVQHVASMNPVEAFSIIDQALEILGIKR